MNGQLNWFKGGLLLGAAFLLAVAFVKPIGVSTQFVIADGKVMLATGADKFQALLPMIPGTLLAAVIGGIFMIIAWKLPDKV